MPGPSGLELQCRLSNGKSLGPVVIVKADRGQTLQAQRKYLVRTKLYLRKTSNGEVSPEFRHHSSSDTSDLKGRYKNGYDRTLESL